MLFQLSAVLFLAIAGGAHAQSQTCNANPDCAALGLADDCCPTNLAGIFLDCCEDLSASCAANPGCVGLDGDCCATEEGVFLYCCFDGGSGEGGYKRDFTYFASTTGESTPGRLWAHTGGVRTTGDYPALANDEYTRNPDVLYDLIYLEGAIPDAGAYVTGEKKMSIDITGTTAPPCTQIILQFESVVSPMEVAPYPTSRHSRYLATVPEIVDGNTRIEFQFLDRPDLGVEDADVNAAVLLFSPGTKTDYQFVYHSLDSYSKCDGGNGCVNSPVKSCPALYMEVEGMAILTSDAVLESNTTATTGRAGKGRILQANPDCSDCANPACVGVDQCAIDTSILTLTEAEPAVPEGVTDPTMAPSAKEMTEEEPVNPPVDEPSTTEGEQAEATSAPESAAGPLGSAVGAMVSLFAALAF